MLPGHLAADLDRRDRLQRAGGADRVDDVAAGERRGVDLDLGLLRWEYQAPAPPPTTASSTTTMIARFMLGLLAR